MGQKSSQYRIRTSSGRLWGWWCLPLLLPVVAAAEPALRFDPLYGPLADLFHPPVDGVPLAKGSGPLLRLRGSSGKAHLEYLKDFRQKEVRVDSAGVHYVPSSAGFPIGASLTLKEDQYLDLGYARELDRLWQDRVLRARKQEANQRSRRGRKLTWNVPFPRAPRAIRRFIGDEGPTLSIKGERTITIAGKSEWTKGEVRTLASRPSKFPSLSMDQESRFTVQGKVGELIDIKITQDTESLNFGLADQLANLIRLDYKGEDDAIFQEIQAGNTTLSLPQTRFVGFRQQAKGLFGVRAKGRLGPVGFTTVASHEKSKSNRRTFKGGALVDTTVIRDYRYLRNKYFYLDLVYRDRLTDFRALMNPQGGIDFNPDDAVDLLEVYINDFNTNNDPQQLAKPGVAHVDINGVPVEQSGFVERGSWHRLDPDLDYILQEELGYIILKRAVPDRHALGVVYRTRGGIQFGSTAGDTLQLKLVKARDARPAFPTWNLEWKNVYQIATGARQGRLFDADKVQVEILREVPGREPEASQEGKSYLQILGLDNKGQDPNSPPDRIIDADYIGLDESQGTLIFPDLTPFNPQNTKYQTLRDTIPELYTQQQERDLVEASRYIIRVVSSSGQQRIKLDQLGIDENSVDVRLNGRSLKKDIDFNVGFTGEITFVGAAAQEVADPAADLEVSFESQDLIGLGSQQKTLLGVRGEYEFWDGDGSIGSTLIYNNERSGERRVRVGNEPARSVVWDMDLRAKFEAPVLTRLVDTLPLLRTNEKSEVSIQAEVAQSRPNLNTKGRGYVDDFEGSERPDLLSVIRTRWAPASLPDGFSADARGRLIWYNPFERVRRTEIWPLQEDQVDAQNNETDVLVLNLAPPAESTGSWGGIMQAFAGGPRDFSLSKFLEVWVRGDRGVVHVDLGTISEDYIPDGILNTEDDPRPGLTTGDNLVSPEEDVGIDRRDLGEELNYYLDLVGADTTGTIDERKERYRGFYPQGNPDDPERDDWNYSERRRDDYSQINGTEGNNQATLNELPDSEDINRDGDLNRRNDYYHYTIDLATDPFVPGTQSPAGWRLYRLRLYTDQTIKVGTPDSSRVEYARILVEDPLLGAGDSLKVEVAQMEVIGNEWQEDEILVVEGSLPVLDRESLNVAVIGTDENEDYSPPPSVKVRRNPQTRTLEREQSLVLDYRELEPGHQVSATKVLSRNANYTKYTRLRMFAYGDSLDLSYVRGDSSDIELFLRFGADSTNYYEYSIRLFPGWRNGRKGWRGNEVDIDLITMAQIKGRLQALPIEAFPTDEFGNPIAVLDTTIADGDFRSGEPANYRVRGNPSMQQIRQLTLGVRNRSDIQAFSGQAYVDEMRLDEARNDAGLAAYAKVNTKLADFMNVEGLVEWREADFRTLNSTGRNSSDLVTNLQTTTNAHKFLPGSWGLSMPLKVALRRTVNLPRFAPNSDVELTEEQKQEQRSQDTKQSFEISLNKRPGKKWLSRWTVDNINMRFSQSQERSFSPVRPLNNSDARTFNFSYNPKFPKLTVKTFTWLAGLAPKDFAQAELRYLPTNLSYRVDMRQLERASLQRTDSDTTFQEDFTLNEKYTAKINPYSAISADYSLEINRDLRKKYDLAKLSFGREVRRVQNTDLNFRPQLFKWLDQTYTFRANYEEINDPRRRSQVAIDTTTGQAIPTRDITTRNDVSARFNLQVRQVFRRLGGGRSGGRGGAEGNKPFFLWRLLTAGSDRIEPISARITRNTNARNFNLTGRPPLLFQLGIEDSLKVEQAAVGLTQQDQWSQRTNRELGSGLRLPMGISLKANLNENLTRQSGSTRSRRRVERQRTLPRVTITWSRANRLPYIKKHLSNSTVNLSFEESNTDQGEGDFDPANLLSQGEGRELKASWNGRWRFGPNTSVEWGRSESVELDFELAGDDSTAGQPRPVRGSSSRDRTSTEFKFDYTLKPRSLPILGQLRSDVRLKLTIGFESEVRSTATGDTKRAPIAETDQWDVRLNATYQFSENFRGNGIVRLENNTNQLTDKTRKIREVRLSGTLFFR